MIVAGPRRSTQSGTVVGSGGCPRRPPSVARTVAPCEQSRVLGGCCLARDASCVHIVLLLGAAYPQGETRHVQETGRADSGCLGLARASFPEPRAAHGQPRGGHRPRRHPPEKSDTPAAPRQARHRQARAGRGAQGEPQAGTRPSVPTNELGSCRRGSIRSSPARDTTSGVFKILEGWKAVASPSSRLRDHSSHRRRSPATRALRTGALRNPAWPVSSCTLAPAASASSRQIDRLADPGLTSGDIVDVDCSRDRARAPSRRTSSPSRTASGRRHATPAGSLVLLAGAGTETTPAGRPRGSRLAQPAAAARTPLTVSRRTLHVRRVAFGTSSHATPAARRAR